jgi:IclR family acetate operon transcriptional repressor
MKSSRRLATKPAAKKPARRVASPKKRAVSQTRTVTVDRPASSGTTVRLLDRAIDLLECLERNRTPMGVRALETATGISKATAQRLLDAFERRGYVQKDRGRYMLAPATVRLARSYLAGDSLVTIAMPVMQHLAALSGETSGLYVRHGFDRLLIQQVEGPHPLRHNTPIGERVPLHLGTSGQVLCAGMAKEDLEEYVDSLGPVQLASGKVLRKKDLVARCEKVRLHGYAAAVDERFAGISGVAAPIVHISKGVVAAINIAGPSVRIKDRLEPLTFEVRNAARDISDQLNRL